LCDVKSQPPDQGFALFAAFHNRLNFAAAADLSGSSALFLAPEAPCCAGQGQVKLLSIKENTE
jgi:hypothetical protein